MTAPPLNDFSSDPLSPQVRALFAHLLHAGLSGVNDLPAADGQRCAQGEAGHERRGTRVWFGLRLQESTILRACYRAYGCPHTLAACEWLAQELEAGRWASLGGPKDWCRVLGIPIVKMGRLLVVEDALRAVLAAAGFTACGQT